MFTIFYILKYKYILEIILTIINTLFRSFCIKRLKSDGSRYDSEVIPTKSLKSVMQSNESAKMKLVSEE